MTRFAVVLVSAALLAGCAHTPPVPEPVNVTVSGPIFPATALDCGDEPLPPDPAAVGSRGGSAAAHADNALRGWGRGCRRKLKSAGAQLDAAGQVVHSTRAAP